MQDTICHFFCENFYALNPNKMFCILISREKDFVFGHKGHTVFNDFNLVVVFNFVTVYLNRLLHDAKTTATLQIPISDLQTWSND